MKIVRKDKGNKGHLDPSEYHSEIVLTLILCAFVSPFIGWLAVKGLKLGSYENGEPTGDFFTNLGVYGDFLGGSTLPFLTLITIAYVYKTFRLQEEQLRTQKEEMEETRATLREQNKTAQLQRFENSFFIQLNALKDRQKTDIHHHHRDVKPLDYAIKVDLEDLYVKMGTHIKDHLKAPRETKWMLYKDVMQSLFEHEFHIFSNPDFKNYIFSIMRCFQLLNRYKGIMDDDEVKYYLHYIVDEIGAESFRLSLLYIIVYSKMYPDFFKAIKDLNLDEFILFHESDTKLPSLLTFIKTALITPNLVWV